MKPAASLLLAVLLIVPFGSASIAARQASGSKITGSVIGKDGSPVARAVVTITNYAMINGRRALLEKAVGRTASDGTYGLSGLRSGQIVVAVEIDNQVAMTKGEVPGDEVYLSDGVETRVDFDLRKLATPAK